MYELCYKAAQVEAVKCRPRFEHLEIEDEESQIWNVAGWFKTVINEVEALNEFNFKFVTRHNLQAN